MRKPRVLKAGAKYHVVARANRQEMILEKEELKKVFMKTIKRAKKKYSFEVNNFCIMGNHFHLIIKPKENQNLSRIMQWILSVYAIQFNKRHGYKGHVWYDRFRSKVIYSYWQYVKTFIYIANNPVRAGITNSAVEYRYNGISFIQKGVLGIMEPLSRLLVKQVWRELVAKGSL